jgi:hypothetical protein
MDPGGDGECEERQRRDRAGDHRQAHLSYSELRHCRGISPDPEFHRVALYFASL